MDLRVNECGRKREVYRLNFAFRFSLCFFFIVRGKGPLSKTRTPFLSSLLAAAPPAAGEFAAGEAGAAVATHRLAAAAAPRPQREGGQQG